MLFRGGFSSHDSILAIAANPAFALDESDLAPDASGYTADLLPRLRARHPEAAEAVVTQIRADGRDDVCAIVLGRDAPAARLDHWLAVAAPVDGFVGFAIGRSIWEDPIADHNHGKASEDETVTEIARRYLGFARQYWAATGHPQG